MLCDLGRLEDGLRSFDQALAARPDYAEGWCSRGVVLRKLGRPADALGRRPAQTGRGAGQPLRLSELSH